MRPRTAGPLLLAGVAVAAGDLLGLRLAGGSAPPAGAVLLAAGLSALPPALGALRDAPLPAGGAVSPPARRSRAGPILLLGACGLAGTSVGLAAGRASAASCLATLDGRSRVAASGVAAHDLPSPAAAGRRGRGEGAGPGRAAGAPPGRAEAASGEAAAPGPGRGTPRAPSRRLELRSVRITAGGRACGVPRLLARVRPPAGGVTAGGAVRVEGRWIRFDDGGAVRPLSRYGMVRGRVAVAGAGRDAGGSEPVVAGEVGPLARGVLALRARAARRLEARLPADIAPLARALVLAERSGLEPALARRFADAGMAHLLAISGLHVGILAAGVLWAVGRFVRTRWRYLAAATLVAGYVVVIGAPPAALRAALLFAGWAAGRHRGAPARPTELVGAAAVLVLLADPAALLGASFQLSFAGFGGLLVGGAVARRLTDALRRRGRPPGPRRERGLVAVAAGTGAFAATAPLAAHHFQRTAPVAVAANFAGVPLVTLGLAALAGTLVLPGAAAELAGGAATVTLRLLVTAVAFFSGLPFGHGDAAPPGRIYWLVAGCLGAAAVALARGSPAPRAAVPACAAAAIGLAGPVLAGLGPDRSLLCQLDVGQGDAAVVRTRRGHWLVFDAGPRSGSRDAGLRVLTPFMRDRGARSLELFVLSHPHLDHLGGATAVLDRFRVGRVLDAGNPLASGAYAEFLDAVAEEGARWIPARRGARFRVDEAEVAVLAPAAGGEALWRGGARDANEASVAVRVRLGERFVYVNTGDAPREQEAWILDRWPDDALRAIVLKAGHHGSRTSTGRRWLGAVRPRVAVVSAGEGNRYGHPHRETLRRLEAAGVDSVWRTDRDGHFCVEVRPDGAWRIRGEGAWRPGLPAAGAPAAARRFRPLPPSSSFRRSLRWRDPSSP